MIKNFDDVVHDSKLEFDVAIVGAGACGLTLARQLAGQQLRVAVLESGLSKSAPEHEQLNSTIGINKIWSDIQRDAREKFHGELASNWDGNTQQFGVRCRGLGGSTQSWAGKSAAFDNIDYQDRSWVPNSGWPISSAELAPYLDRAADVLNLGPNCYDERLWDLIGQSPPEPEIDPKLFSSFFWQFSRGRANPMDTMRFGDEIKLSPMPNVCIYLNATVISINTNETGDSFTGFDVSTIEGKRAKIKARFGFLAASAIENARLLLASNQVHPEGLGNQNDNVGRYLTDHLMAPVARFDSSQAAEVSKRFGFYGLRHNGRSHMYAHGLQIARSRQREEELLNGAIFLLEERSHEDALSAIVRLAKGRSKSFLRDIGLILKNPLNVLKVVGLRVLEHDRFSKRLRKFIVDQILRFAPNSAAREYRFKGLPYKLDGIQVYAICEQAPAPDNRVVLSDQKDQLGQRLPEVRWQYGQLERQTMKRLTEYVATAFENAGLPTPTRPEWAYSEFKEEAPIIDSGHTMGTTRMSENPKMGVVDTDCQVHDVSGLFVAGGSIMPTTGHANPTLTMLALALRLSDHVKRIAIGKSPTQGR